MTKKKTFWTMVLQFLLYFVVSQGAIVVGMLIAALFTGITHRGMTKEAFIDSLTSSSLLPWAMIAGNIVLIAIFLGGRMFRLRLGRIHRDQMWAAAGRTALIAWGWAFTEIALLVLTGYGDLFADEEENFVALSNMLKGPLGLIAGGVLVPIVEEIVFRGAVLGGLLRMRMKPWMAIGLSALIFALCHGTMTQLPGTMIFGIIAGWLCWSTKSLLPSMILHIVNNSTASFLITFSNNPNENPSTQICWLLLIVFLPTLLFGLRWFHQKRYLSKFSE